MNDDRRIFFSVIVPVSRKNELICLLEGLNNQDFDPDKFEVILVSDMEMKNFDYPFLIQQVYSSSTHPGKKRNMGIEKARGKYYAFIDDDCIPGENWLSEAEKLLKEHPVVSGPSRIDTVEFSKQLARAISTSFWGRGNNMHANYKEEHVQFYDVGFYNVFIESSVWEKVNGCDEEANYLMDDKELFYLISKKGILSYNSPKIEVNHNFRKFPFEYLRNAFTRKFQTGINFFVYNEIFFKQPVFYLIYSSFIVLPLMMIFIPKIFLLCLILYYMFQMVIYVSFIKKNILIYLLLPGSVILTNTTMLTAMFFGSIYYFFSKKKYERAKQWKKRRLEKIINE